MKSETNGINADRHLCKCCKYKAKGRAGCDFYVQTGMRRPCDVEECYLWKEDVEIKQSDRGSQDDLFYESLAAGIVKQASKDYTDACKKKHIGKYKNDKDKLNCEYTLAECRNFFRSVWFFELTGLNGKDILKKLDAMIEGLKEKEWKKI